MIEKAKETQKKTIKKWLTNNYVGGGKDIAVWSDHYFRLSHFSAADFASCAFCDSNTPSTDKARRILDRMAKAGFIQRHKTYGPVWYKFSRETCDCLAVEATQELLANGLKTQGGAA